MSVVTAVVCVLVALVSAASGVPKIARSARMVEEAVRLGMPVGAYSIIGVLEVAAAVGLLTGFVIAPLGAAAAAGLALLMAGAVVAHVRAGDPVAASMPAAIVGVMALLALVLRLTTT